MLDKHTFNFSNRFLGYSIRLLIHYLKFQEVPIPLIAQELLGQKGLVDGMHLFDAIYDEPTALVCL